MRSNLNKFEHVGGGGHRALSRRMRSLVQGGLGPGPCIVGTLLLTGQTYTTENITFATPLTGCN